MIDLSKYPKTDKFKIIDTIGIPHSFCITSRHVAYASKHYNGILGNNTLETFELNQGPTCGVKGCNLSYAEHEIALLVEVNDPRELKDISELQAYLLKCKPICKADKCVGFAFKQK